MNELVIKFMRSLKDAEKKKYFCVEPSEKTIGIPTPSPRSWEIVSNLLDLNVDEFTLLEMISGAIGKEAAQKFVEFKNLQQGCSLKFILYNEPNKPFDFSKISEKNLANLCLELRDLINEDFTGHNINDIYMRVGDLLNYILSRPGYIKMIFNLNDYQKDRPKFTKILTQYQNQTTIDLVNKILEGIL